MPLADKMRKLAGFFVVMPETPIGETQSLNTDEIDRRLAAMDARLGGAPAAEGVRSVPELVRQSAGPDLEQITLTDAPAPPDSGALDFGAIYFAANLPEAPFTAEQTLDMLGKLPANLPLDIKRQTIQATLTTLGATVGASAESIVADAARKLAALDAYAKKIDENSDALIQLAESEIAQLTIQIETKRAAIQAVRQRQQGVHTGCDAEADRLDEVLEFFSLDVGASRYAGDAGTPPPLPPQSG